MTKTQIILQYYSNLLGGSERATPRYGEHETPINDNGKLVLISGYDEVQMAISRLKNEKATEADSLLAELFQLDGEKQNMDG